MVQDDNNFDEVEEALEEGLADGIEKLHSETLRTLTENMRQGKDALGNAWKPLEPETIAAKGSSTPLIDEGTLLSNIQSASEMDRDALIGILGTNLEYAPVHEFGLPEQGIPARPIFSPAAEYASRRSQEILTDEIASKIESKVD